MSNPILVFYGSYRSDRMGIRLAEFVVERLRRRGEAVELIDAKAVNLPMLDRMYKEYPAGEAPERLDRLARKIRDADGFVFVTGEYNWGVQPGLKNLTDHFLEEWFWRPAAIVSYSAGACPAPGPQPLGMARSPRWGWWWFQAQLPLARLDRPSLSMVRR
jgi:NAD(P)H-dependent FMN reductase